MKIKKNFNFSLIPKILTIIFICFISLFSLDVFGEYYNFFDIILALIIHNIPSLILICVLILAWSYPIVGAISFLIFGLFFLKSIIISIISFIIAALFIINLFVKKS